MLPFGSDANVGATHTRTSDNRDSSVTSVLLTENNLSGTMPSELGALTNVDTINFFMNMLTGSLPEIFTDLSALKTFDVEANMLAGSAFPNSVPVGSTVESWYASFNEFSGTVCSLSTLDSRQS